jgi:hypothetical protein
MFWLVAVSYKFQLLVYTVDLIFGFMIMNLIFGNYYFGRECFPIIRPGMGPTLEINWYFGLWLLILAGNVSLYKAGHGSHLRKDNFCLIILCDRGVGRPIWPTGLSYTELPLRGRLKRTPVFWSSSLGLALWGMHAFGT